MYKGLRVVVVIPALNEELAIGHVINDLWCLRSPEQVCIIDHIAVCDNGSTDKTAAIADFCGAHVVSQPIAGYGLACLTAIDSLPESDIVLFVDGDRSCDISQAILLLEGIFSGDDVAIGSRTLGSMEPGSLTIPQQFGNWFAAFLIKILWNYKVTDLGPFRAVRTRALRQIQMNDQSFGWTVEMQVKSIILGLQMNEYPVDSVVRLGQSKISGTVKGSINAGIGILSMIAKLKLKFKKTSKLIATNTN